MDKREIDISTLHLGCLRINFTQISSNNTSEISLLSEYIIRGLNIRTHNQYFNIKSEVRD